MNALRVAVVGAGWAGLACAVRLAQARAQVTLFDSAHRAGGRARTVEVAGVTVDNGQHILIGAYARCLALLQAVGIDEPDVLLRVPLDLDCPGRFRFAAPDLPAPWHMLAGVIGAHGFTWSERWALLRWMAHLRWTGYRVDARATVAQWTATLPVAVRARLIDPLCLSALNTPPATASARVMATVLRDTLGAHPRDADLLIPRVDLARVFPDAALATLRAADATVHLGATVRALSRDAAHWRLDACDTPFDRVVLATPPWVTRRLLADLDDARVHDSLRCLDALTWEPITTVYLKPRTARALPRPMIALEPDVARGAVGQFAFDRSLCGGPAGWWSVVVSASADTLSQSTSTLARRCADQLAQVLGAPIEVDAAHVIHEKRATFACVPGLERPAPRCGLPGVVLAGDYTQGDYPATLEQAVRSGERAARLALEDHA